MPELPEEPVDVQMEESLPFAGLLDDLLEGWNAAPAGEEEEAAPPDAETPPAPPEEPDAVCAGQMLSLLEMPAVSLRIAPPPEFPPPDPPASAASLTLEECADVPEPMEAPEEPAATYQETEAEAEPCAAPVCQSVLADSAVVELVEETESPVAELASAAEPDAEIATPSMPDASGEPETSLAALLGAMEEEVRTAEPLPAPAARAAARSLDRYITFVLADSTYAVELKHVMEADRIPKTTSVPGVPVFLRGVTNLRGEILPLLDLRLLMGLEPAEQLAAGRMLVVRTTNSGGACGLVVDRLGGMALMDRAELQAGHMDPTDRLGLLLSAVGESRGHLVNVLDLDRLFATSEVRALAGM